MMYTFERRVKKCLYSRRCTLKTQPYAYSGQRTHQRSSSIRWPVNASTQKFKWAIRANEDNDKQSISILLGMSESFQAGKNRHSSHAGDTTTPSECLPIRRWLGCCCCCSCQYYTDHMPFHNNKNNNDINCNNNSSNSIIRKEYSDWMQWALTKWNCMYASSLKSY